MISSVFNLFFASDLYEIEVNGTLVRKIKKHSQDGTFKHMDFKELPEEVQEELVQKVMELYK